MASADRDDEAPNSAPLGAMASLLWKLDKLNGTNDGGSISLLKDNIRELLEKLKKLSGVHDPPLTVSYWLKHARELSYDIEAYLDNLDAQTEDNPDDSDAKMEDCIDDSDDETEYSVDGSDAKMEGSIDDSDDETKEGSVDDSDYKISGFRTRAEGMIERYKSFSLDSVLNSPTATTTILSPRPSRDVVLGDQKTKLISLLKPKDENDNQLKIVSIFGDEGIGKSMLIQEIWRVSFKEKEIWHELESEVNIKRAFVRMGKKPDVRMILRSILSQVSLQEPAKDSGVINLIQDIRKHLEQKRYFIIVEDVRSLSVWDVVGRAFPSCSFGSRVITTTSDEDVALACCSYLLEHNYVMEPLSVGDCTELFIRTVVGSGTVSFQLSNDVSDEIKRKCGGLPLAIMWTAILVASQPEIKEKLCQLETEQGLSKMEKEENLNSDVMKFLVKNLRTESTPVEILNQVLKLCYNSLPHYLKTCLLYLSLYPENYLFLKEDLVKLWMAEGFICTSEADKVKAAGRYFDVLVSLGLIQRIDINCNQQHHQGEVVEDEEEEYPLRVPYVVHPTVFDFITNKSTKDNFITVINYSQLMVASEEKIRRLSLHFGSATYACTPESIGLSHVRTLSFMGLLSCMPSLVEFKLVRVLILHLWADDGDKKFPLAEICRLVLLRYLQVRCNVTVELPGQIGCLKHLKTLEINSVVTAVPSDVFHLSRLLHLHLGLKQNLTPGLVAAVNAISSDELLPPLNDSSSTSTPSVQIFELLLPICIFSRLPKWIPQLRKLSILEIVVRELLTTDIDMLADLPTLTALSLYVRIPTTGNIIFQRGAFPALKYFRFMCGVLSLDFQEEAVPNLQRLTIEFNVRKRGKYDNILAGIQHLLNLQEVVASIGATMGTEENDSIAAESALKDAINKHPRPTKFNVKRVHQVEEEYPPPPLGPLSLNEQEEVPVIHFQQTEESTNEQPINLDKKPAKDTHEHANFGSEKDETKLATGSEAPSDPLPGLRNFNLPELEVATNKFSEENLIGRGGWGKVFKGVLLNGLVVAIKVFISHLRGDEVLHNEIMIGKTLQHKNVVKTLGYCIDNKVVSSVWLECVGQEVEVIIQRHIVVTGYLPNGTLGNRLQRGAERIYWPFCFRIIQGIAQGLRYLHEKNVVHLDSKPENIMFDSDMNPVIIDLGISVVLDKEVDFITADEPRATLGYMAPEYIEKGMVSKKCDVFSFGIVLLKTITYACSKVEFHNWNYGPDKWDAVLEQGVDKMKQLFDPELVEESELMDVARCLNVGQLCLEFDPADRPTMAEVLDMLNGEKEVPARKNKRRA